MDGVYTSRAAELNVLMEKLPAALRGVGTSQLRYAVCWDAFFVFEVRWEIRISPVQESAADFLGIPAR